MALDNQDDRREGLMNLVSGSIGSRDSPKGSFPLELMTWKYVLITFL